MVSLLRQPPNPDRMCSRLFLRDEPRVTPRPSAPSKGRLGAAGCCIPRLAGFDRMDLVSVRAHVECIAALVAVNITVGFQIQMQIFASEAGRLLFLSLYDYCRYLLWTWCLISILPSRPVERQKEEQYDCNPENASGSGERYSKQAPILVNHK